MSFADDLWRWGIYPAVAANVGYWVPVFVFEALRLRQWAAATAAGSAAAATRTDDGFIVYKGGPSEPLSRPPAIALEWLHGAARCQPGTRAPGRLPGPAQC